MKKILAILCLGIGITGNAQQFDVSAEFIPRFEYRHGFKTLIPDDVDAASFVSQRSRLILNYGSEKLNARFSAQNVRVWGDVGTLAASDVNGTAIHEAWAEAVLNPKFSLKIGRQEIAYDDQRIFGSVNWAQQARSHDAFVAKFKPNANNRLDFGLALSADSESLFKQDYSVNNYKAFQYLWYHLKADNIGVSILLLNNGLVYDKDGEQEVDYNQTIGSHFKYAKDKLKTDASVYFQTGSIEETDLSALNAALNINYAINQQFNAGIGAEYLSGTDMDSTDDKLKSFTPWFGTNHKFNGWMDYFYVGGPKWTVGLVDFHGTLAYKKDKFSVVLKPHVFSSAATVVDGAGDKMSNSLGTELDLKLGYKIAKDINLNVGYSQLFATETLERLKSGNKDNTNNWAWVMFTFKPKLFSYSK